ncbi:YMGG-like glycine zipper-containing protein [Persicitalea sp.]|uniref:YMGG-like glycine zipper-containing protein n=1 Tax=Persicitalea sp. TaxID=3100273 RepID=UPI0035930801
MKKLIGIALIASTLYSCGGIDNQKSENQSNAALQIELAQAKQENEILKLRHELGMLKAEQETADPARVAALENSNARYAYFGNTLPTDTRHTQQVDNEWTENEAKSTDAYKSGNKAPTAETKPAAEVKKKGMSTPVKGALIGAGVGAATGAIVAKNNRVKGAVIGAVVGAGAGAGTGVIIDKRKEKKAESTPYFASNTFLR